MCHMNYPPYLPNKPQKNIYYNGDKVGQIQEMFHNIQIDLSRNTRFYHWIDENVWLFHFDHVIGNMPPNYALVIDASLEELIDGTEAGKNSKERKRLLKAVKDYIYRILSTAKALEAEDYENIKNTFEKMLTNRAETLTEALQRILFWSSIMWQSGHRLLGLGRLDLLLDRFSEESEQEVLSIFEDFFVELHRYYEFKSTALLGDIGQIIVIGGLGADGVYFRNSITDNILEALEKLGITDPKILLRVSSQMPSDLLKNALECIASGIGSPLLSNDDVIIPCLEEFGYKKADAGNYVTSACWEPLSFGNSLEQNNIDNINYARAFEKMARDISMVSCKDFEELTKLYQWHLEKEIDQVIEKVLSVRWEEDPLFTFFSQSEGDVKDISEGGTRYRNYGVLSVGISNAVDSLLNMKHIIFEEKGIDIREFREIWTENKEELRVQIEDSRIKHYFCKDQEEVILLVNELLEITKERLSLVRNRFGGKIKFGLSSPAYMVAGERTGATFDGRKDGDSLDVHISAKDAVSYTEQILFASKLAYDGYCSNGNVLDFFTTPNFIKNDLEKFQTLIETGIRLGFFQIQMNVISSGMLIRAKRDPDKYQDLIVRVWGFSAYFVDLPESYQNMLIERALRSEGQINT